MTDPRANPELVGHDDAARTLEEAALSGRMHHAWLIAGPTGVGKATLAYRFARWLLAGMPPTPQGKTPLYLPEANATFRRVAAAAHADLFTLAPTVGKGGRKEVLRVDDARDALRFMALTAAEGGWRAVVVEDVEQSERELVQNILLKTLEEPPPRTVQLLVTSAPDRLLPTIRSRCRRLDLAPLSEPALTGLLTRWMPEMGGPDRLRLAHIADGCPGRALLLAEGRAGAADHGGGGLRRPAAARSPPHPRHRRPRHHPARRRGADHLPRPAAPGARRRAARCRPRHRPGALDRRAFACRVVHPVGKARPPRG
ncbi:DNA replication protein DnaC [Paeniroseomonas aquatica]|uniref:DNA replication protein DnaC n=1 Tax=Paeniroseomonas aquatica TaxID=373043 RepID=UPI00360D3089